VVAKRDERGPMALKNVEDGGTSPPGDAICIDIHASGAGEKNGACIGVSEFAICESKGGYAKEWHGRWVQPLVGLRGLAHDESLWCHAGEGQ